MNLTAELERLARRDDLATASVTAYLVDFRQALAVAKLHICANCERFSRARKPVGVGNCRQHGEVWSFVPFQCPDFVLSTEPAAPAFAPVCPFALELGSRS